MSKFKGKTFAAQIEAFADKTVKQMTVVMQDSIFDVLEAAQTPQPSVEQTGGTYEIGKIPVKESDLIRSLASELNGGGFGPEDEASFQLVIAQMKIGDAARFAWTAAHALPIEMGWETSTGKIVGGRQFVGTNAARFPEFVEANAARIKRK